MLKLIVVILLLLTYIMYSSSKDIFEKNDLKIVNNNNLLDNVATFILSMF